MKTEQKIAVLTYQSKHRKTYDTLCLLKAKGYQAVFVYASPFHYKKKYKPLFEHRPSVMEGMPSVREQCLNFGYTYVEGELEEFDIPSDYIVLICGAGILPDDFVTSHMIINSHPGYLPNCRGLDAYKWAIYEGEPIGVTTHFLGKEIDAGKVIDRTCIAIEEGDTIHTLARKVYETEISLLVSAVGASENSCLDISSPKYPVHKRMPREYEEQLFTLFDKRKKLELKKEKELASKTGRG